MNDIIDWCVVGDIRIARGFKWNILWTLKTVNTNRYSNYFAYWRVLLSSHLFLIRYARHSLWHALLNTEKPKGDVVGGYSLSGGVTYCAMSQMLTWWLYFSFSRSLSKLCSRSNTILPLLSSGLRANNEGCSWTISFVRGRQRCLLYAYSETIANRVGKSQCPWSFVFVIELIIFNNACVV